MGSITSSVNVLSGIKEAADKAFEPDWMKEIEEAQNEALAIASKPSYPPLDDELVGPPELEEELDPPSPAVQQFEEKRRTRQKSQKPQKDGSTGIGNLVFADYLPMDWQSADTIINANNEVVRVSRESVPLMNMIDIPDWGIKDFINERVNWQKSLTSLTGEPGFFYFKIFFKFDTSFGLFGGIMDKGMYGNTNSANGYFSILERGKRYSQEDIRSRKLALHKFVGTLSFISSTCPWFFKSIKDVNESIVGDLNNPTKQRTLEIECSEDAVDMRLMTLMDLYRYAAYDFTNFKEILPDNLRKFDMDIVIFHTPIRYYQTSSKDLLGRKTNYKSLNSQNLSERMSFKLFSFQNCEFELSSVSSVIPSTMDNSTPFNLKPTLKISYDRCYQHTLNEWTQILFGDSGMLWDQINNINAVASNDLDTRVKQQKYAITNQTYHNDNSSTWKALVDATEDTIGAAMRIVSPELALGNLYGNYGVDSKYFRSKIQKLKGNAIDNHLELDKSQVDDPIRNVWGGLKAMSQNFIDNYKEQYNSYKKKFSFAAAKNNTTTPGVKDAYDFFSTKGGANNYHSNAVTGEYKAGDDYMNPGERKPSSVLKESNYSGQYDVNNTRNKFNTFKDKIDHLRHSNDIDNTPPNVGDVYDEKIDSLYKGTIDRQVGRTSVSTESDYSGQYDTNNAKNQFNKHKQMLEHLRHSFEVDNTQPNVHDVYDEKIDLLHKGTLQRD